MAFKIIETYSEEETFSLGVQIGSAAHAGQVFCLAGDLGAGKTVLAKGVARGLGITEMVNSPTFTVMQIYEGGRLTLYHFDVYRIEDISEMDEIGIEDYFYGDGVCLVEWADRIEEILPEGSVRITIDKDRNKGFDYRSFRFEWQNFQTEYVREK